MRGGAARHRSFALVLAGGGVRGLAHAGALRALEHYGWRPQAIVGVSMGAIVGATYSLNEGWYGALANLNTSGFPKPVARSHRTLRGRIRNLLASERAFAEMLLGWGVGSASLEQGRRLLTALTQDKNLEDGRIPVVAVATDLISGRRMVLEHGRAADLVYASAALAGVLPPFVCGQHLLADGSYAGAIPVDVARSFGTERVMVIYPSQVHLPHSVHNGFEAMRRAEDISLSAQAQVHLKEADFVLVPNFPCLIDALDFRHKRLCVARGARVVRDNLPSLRRLLDH